MDRLAACHATFGFLQMAGPVRGRHPSAPNCQHVKRSLSLTDRRGLISPGRGSARGLISPLPMGMRSRRGGGGVTAAEGSGGATGGETGSHSMSRMHDFSMLMHALGRTAGQMAMLPSAAAAMDFDTAAGDSGIGGIGADGAMGVRRRQGRSRDSRREQTMFKLWQRGGGAPGAGRLLTAGQLLISLRYSPADAQLWIGVHRATGLRASAPFVIIWLLREGQKPEKQSSPKPTGSSGRRFSIAPVFDDAFMFDVSPSDVQCGTTTVVVLMMNCNSASGAGDSDAEIGYCVFGELGADEIGRWHWRETMGQPGRVITQWHCLITEC